MSLTSRDNRGPFTSSRNLVRALAMWGAAFLGMTVAACGADAPVGAVQQTAATTEAVSGITAFASNVTTTGGSDVGLPVTGQYVFSDTAGLPESGTTYRWTYGDGTFLASSISYTPTSKDIGRHLVFCVTPADANGPGAQVCSSETHEVDSVTASNVAISGTPAVGQTLIGSYTYASAAGVAESGSSLVWNRVSNGVTTQVGTGSQYTVALADEDSTLSFCVTPADRRTAGPQVCSSVYVPPPGPTAAQARQDLINDGLSASAVGNMSDEEVIRLDQLDAEVLVFNVAYLSSVQQRAIATKVGALTSLEFSNLIQLSSADQNYLIGLSLAQMKSDLDALG